MSGRLRSFLWAFGVTSVILLWVPPGIFDPTLTGRLALYPLAGAALLWAGRRRTGRYHSLAGLLLAGLPVVWILAAPIPVQAIPQAVRWASFGMMVAGLSGLAAGGGRRQVLAGVCAAGALAGLTVIALGPEGTAGNPNRLGALLALSVVACASDQTGLPLRGRLALGLPAAVGLVLSGFYTGWIGAVLGLLWLFSGERLGLRPIYPAALLLAGQLLLPLAPQAAGRLHPSLRLRALIWRQGIELSAQRFPLGVGTGQARLHIHSAGPEELRRLAGVEKRIDHLHSDLLTPPVEQGLAGLTLLALLLVWVAKASGGCARGSILLAAWPLAATDLPLATPLGAIPLAAAMACALPARGRTAIPAWLPAGLGLAALAWGVAVTLGYAEMRKGREAAASGRHAEAGEAMESACSLIPFEERCRLYLAASRFAQGAPLAAAEAAGEFNAIYPGYWRGHRIEGGILMALDRQEEAASAFVSALRLAPSDSLRVRNRLALGALHSIPPTETDRLLLADALLATFRIPEALTPGECRMQAVSIEELADSLAGHGETAKRLRARAERFRIFADTLEVRRMRRR
jgi:tetratricopeptide (TPR) repeat protein